MRAPDYSGGGLVNLAAELEHRLIGSSASPPLHPHLAGSIPPADSYILVLFDGMGTGQLDHRNAGRLRSDLSGSLDAPFSTQTSVSTATLASGLPPSQHGLISYLLMLPGGVVNTLWWFYPGGEAAEFELSRFLPEPVLGERLAGGGAEAVVVQPAAFLGGPLDRVLYRSTRVVGSNGSDEQIERTIAEASRPGRMVLCYVPDVDAAAHAEGFASDGYAAAFTRAAGIWDELARRLPQGVALLGTADHGMVHIERRVEVAAPPDLVFAGDGRVLHLHGPDDLASDFAASLPGTWIPFDAASEWWGPGPFHPDFEQRAPDSLIVADDGVAFSHAANSVPLVCEHGGVTEDELRIPILVGGT